MFAPANFYCLNKFLTTTGPDLMFLIETWHHENHPNLLPDRGFNMLLSPSVDERAGGVGILYRSTLIVSPLFPEFHARNLLLARLSSSSGRPVILMSVYLPPDSARKREAVAHLGRVVTFLRERYSSFSLLCFGDLNVDFVRNPASPNTIYLSKALDQCGLSLYSYLNGERFTRYHGDAGSHLDYFFGVGVHIGEVSVKHSIGRSDHRIVTCEATRLLPGGEAESCFRRGERRSF